jgi:hypothetical protein
MAVCILPSLAYAQPLSIPSSLAYAQPPSIPYQTMNSAFQALQGAIMQYSTDENNQIIALRQQIADINHYWKQWCGKNKNCTRIIKKKPIIPKNAELYCILSDKKDNKK